MYKILSTVVVLFFCFSLAATAQKSPADNSESVPYQPRQVEIVAPSKKKDKKSKKDPVEVKPTPTETDVPANSTGDTQTVRIPLYVYDKSGNPVTDLKASDIRVLVDGGEREFSAFEAVNPPRDILLILDTSPSLAFEEKDLRNAVLMLIEALQPGDKLQIISFNSEVSILSESTGDAEILRKAVKKLKTGDGTSIYEATREIFRKHLSGKTPPVVIMLTDGVDTTSRRVNYEKALIEAERSGAVVFPFYFDTSELMAASTRRIPPSVFGRNFPRASIDAKQEYEIGRAYLQDIAALSGGRTIVVKKLTDVDKQDFEAALKIITPQYYLSINSMETAGTFQRRQIKVRVLRPNLKVFARGSYVTGAK